MFFRCHCTGPWSSWNLALLAHIYAKVAICKSCEGDRRRHTLKRLSPENPRSGTITARSSGAGLVSVPAGSPAEIKSSMGGGRPGTPLPRFLLNTPSRWGLPATSGNIARHISPPISTSAHLSRAPMAGETAPRTPRGL